MCRTYSDRPTPFFYDQKLLFGFFKKLYTIWLLPRLAPSLANSSWSSSSSLTLADLVLSLPWNRLLLVYASKKSVFTRASQRSLACLSSIFSKLCCPLLVLTSYLVFFKKRPCFFYRLWWVASSLFISVTVRGHSWACTTHRVIVLHKARRASNSAAANLGLRQRHQSTSSNSAVPTVMLITTSLVYVLFTVSVCVLHVFVTHVLGVLKPGEEHCILRFNPGWS